jgi:dienelactone hydrolase
MQQNVGTIDRSLRVLVAAGAVAGSGVLGFSTAGGIVLLAVAAVMAVTAASGFCPLYRLLGVGTNRGGGSQPGGHRGFHLHRAA